MDLNDLNKVLITVNKLLQIQWKANLPWIVFLTSDRKGGASMPFGYILVSFSFSIFLGNLVGRFTRRI